MDLFFEILQLSLGTRVFLSMMPSEEEWRLVYAHSSEQAIVGTMQIGLERLPKKQLPADRRMMLQWIGITQVIEQKNMIINEAVVSLCKELTQYGIRFLVVKGQTLAPLYPKPSSRQSGDIDFLVHPDSWDKAIEALECRVASGDIEGYEKGNALKHVEWNKNGVEYEMHRSLASLSCDRHQRYWDSIVMPEAWDEPWTVVINGYNVPTLAPSYNAIYVFEHIFEHFIKEGIGFRQFIDWFCLLKNESSHIDRSIMEQHLKGIGLFKAFCEMGAVLTDYLGLDKVFFPFAISERAHKTVPKLTNRILELGNFGHNKTYLQDRGVIHGVQRIGFMLRQASQYGHYAPAEAWGAIPHMFKWWIIKSKIRQHV